MPLNKKLLVKSMVASFLITLLLMLMSYLPFWAILSKEQDAGFPQYPFVISAIAIFLILTAVFYFDIRKILERSWR